MPLKYDPELVQRIANMYIDGASLALTGRHFRISYGTVYNIMREYKGGLFLRKRGKRGVVTGLGRKYPDISKEWYAKFSNKEQFDFLSNIVLRLATKGIAFSTSIEFMEFVEQAYHDPVFNNLHHIWAINEYDKLLKPSLILILSVKDGGDYTTGNLKFCTAFEKRLRGTMPIREWLNLKSRIINGIHSYLN